MAAVYAAVNGTAINPLSAGGDSDSVADVRGLIARDVPLAFGFALPGMALSIRSFDMRLMAVVSRVGVRLVNDEIIVPGLTVGAEDPISKIPQYKFCGCRAGKADGSHGEPPGRVPGRTQKGTHEKSDEQDGHRRRPAGMKATKRRSDEGTKR